MAVATDTKKGGGGGILVVAAAMAGVGAYLIAHRKPAGSTTTTGQVRGYTTRPSWWAGQSVAVKQAAQTFFDLLGRWPDLAGATFFAQTWFSGQVITPWGAGIGGFGNWIVQNSGQEFVSRVTTMAGGSTDAKAWTEMAFFAVLNRQMDPTTAQAQAWFSQYSMQGPVAVATNFTNSAEFAADVQAEAATP